MILSEKANDLLVTFSKAAQDWGWTVDQGTSKMIAYSRLTTIENTV